MRVSRHTRTKPNIASSRWHAQANETAFPERITEDIEALLRPKAPRLTDDDLLRVFRELSSETKARMVDPFRRILSEENVLPIGRTGLIGGANQD